MRIVPFEPWHLMQIEVRPEQRLNDDALQRTENAVALAEAGSCFTAIEGATPLAIGGVVNRGPGRAVAWAVISPASLTRFRPIHREVKRFIEMHNYRRLEISIDPRHAAMQNWARHLGFRREGLMRSYMPDGSDAELWARIGDDFR